MSGSGPPNRTPADAPRELLAEYVLGTLEPSEKTRVELYLKTSESAREEVRALRESLVALTESLPQSAPPPEVWARLEAELAPTLEPERTPPPVHQNAAGWSPLLGWGLTACFGLLAAAQLVWGLQTQAAYRRTGADAQLIVSFLAQPATSRIPLQGPSATPLGSVLLEPGGDALFVLAHSPAAGSVYQAWGHRTDDWTPSSGEQLTSLGTSDDGIFSVPPDGFAALYLSLEPAGGSPQPTEALAQVSVLGSHPGAPLELSSPPSGSVSNRDGVIVSGRVQSSASALSYRVNGGEARPVPVAGTRFSFTVTGLSEGDNTIAVTATLTQGQVSQEVTEEIIVRYAP